MKRKPGTALITGASRGLGRALAGGLAEIGWSLVIDGRDESSLREAERELVDRTSVVGIVGDINDPEHRRQLADAVAVEGGLDLLVNNAGSLGTSPLPSLLDYPLDDLLELFRTNVVAQLGIIQSVRPYLKDGARVVNITSDAGVEAYEGWGGYGAGKSALDHLTRVLALENSTLCFYSLDPGDLRTEMHQAAFPGEDISDRPEPSSALPGFLRLVDSDFPSGGRYRASELAKEVEV